MTDAKHGTSPAFVRTEDVESRFLPRIGDVVQYAPTAMESSEPSCAAIVVQTYGSVAVDLFVIVPPGPVSDGHTFFKTAVPKVEDFRGPRPHPFLPGRWRWPS